MRITRADWGGMTKSQSFILCARLFAYSSTELKSKKLTPRDRLSDAAPNQACAGWQYIVASHAVY